MGRASSILVVAALFLSGVAIGALGMHLYYWQKLGARAAAARPPGPMMMGWMERELDLTPEQRREIRAILADSMHRGAEMRRELRPRVEELMRDTSERIAAVLTEEQRRRYEELQRHQRPRFERGFLGPPGEGRGPFRRRPGPPPGAPPPPPPEDP